MSPFSARRRRRQNLTGTCRSAESPGKNVKIEESSKPGHALAGTTNRDNREKTSSENAFSQGLQELARSFQTIREL
jgi:hypothetical protein